MHLINSQFRILPRYEPGGDLTLTFQAETGPTQNKEQNSFHMFAPHQNISICSNKGTIGLPESSAADHKKDQIPAISSSFFKRERENQIPK
jgi:hypothetical protein